MYKEAIDAMNAKDNSTRQRVQSTTPLVGQSTLQEMITCSHQ